RGLSNSVTNPGWETLSLSAVSPRSDPGLKGKKRLRRDSTNRSPEIRLDPLECRRRVGLEANHDYRSRIRCPRKAETVRILDTHSVDRDDVGRPFKTRFTLQPFDKREIFAFDGLQVQFGR